MTVVFYLVGAAFAVAAATGIFYLGNRPGRRFACNISAIAFGIAFALQAILADHDRSGHWPVWIYGIAAVAAPVVLIWSSRREERRKLGR